jgi:hypothetical protein
MRAFGRKLRRAGSRFQLLARPGSRPARLYIRGPAQSGGADRSMDVIARAASALSNHQRNALSQISSIRRATTSVSSRAVAAGCSRLSRGAARRHCCRDHRVGNGKLRLAPHKDIDTQAVVSLRRMLTKAGYGASTANAGANGRVA